MESKILNLPRSASTTVHRSVLSEGKTKLIEVRKEEVWKRIHQHNSLKKTGQRPKDSIEPWSESVDEARKIEIMRLGFGLAHNF